MQRPVVALARTAWFRRAVRRRWTACDAGIPAARLDDYRHDMSLISGAQFAHIVAAATRFTPRESPLCFSAGEGDAARTQVGGSARAANAQRGRQGGKRHAPRLAAALSGPLPPHRGRLVLQHGPTSRDRSGRLPHREAGGAIDSIDDGHVLDRVFGRRLDWFAAQHRRSERVELICVGDAPREALHPLSVG